MHACLARLGADRQAWMRCGKGLPRHHPKRGDTHLSLCPGRKCSFHAVISKRMTAAMSATSSYLRGKIIAVLGDVTDLPAAIP